MKYRSFSALPCNEGLTFAEIDTDALRFNYRQLQARLGADCRPIAIVKADAYGHGIPICVPALLREGCDFFAVATLEEAIAVREICDREGVNADVLTLGYTDFSALGKLVEHNLIQTVLNEHYGKLLAQHAERLGVRVRVHIAVDTGMRRVGLCACDDKSIAATADVIWKMSQCQALCLEGVFSHFARADEETADADAFTRLQIARFEALNDALCQKGVTLPFLHICNSAGTLRFADAQRNGVRLGLSLYGFSVEDQAALPLRPVMRLCTHAVHVEMLPAGEPLGYGGTFVADTPRKIATLPVGYADGWLRSYGGATVALYTETGRHLCRIVGRICMDQCMIDVTDTDARVGDTVVLFGDADLDAATLASGAGTIPYEVMTSVSGRVLRKEKSKCE